MSNTYQVSGSEPDKIVKSYSYKKENISYPIYNFIRHLLDFFNKNCPTLNKCFKINSKDEHFNNCSCEKGICVLETQCKVSALVFNNIIGNPNRTVEKKTIQEMKRIILKMKNQTLLNFCIAVNSVEPEFVGHRFNILCLYENNTFIFFRIQSYVSSYPFSYKELSFKELYNEMKNFIDIFELSSEKIFTKEDSLFWKKMTGETLEIGNFKPDDIYYFKYYKYRIKNIDIWKNRILNRIKNEIHKTRKMTTRTIKNLNSIKNSWPFESSIGQKSFSHILKKLQVTQRNLKISIETNYLSKEVSLLFPSQTSLKKNEFIPTFLNEQENNEQENNEQENNEQENNEQENNEQENNEQENNEQENNEQENKYNE